MFIWHDLASYLNKGSGCIAIDLRTDLPTNENHTALIICLYIVGDAATCTNGFPTKLVYDITFPVGPST